jgi:hypothetical protein
MWAGGMFHFHEIETVYKVAQVLSWMTGAGGRGWHALMHYFGLRGIEAPAPPFAAVGWSLFVYSCSISESPLRHMPMAFHMISYKTGNLLLDLPQLGILGQDWTSEEVARLTLMREHADRLTNEVMALNRWLDEDPAARIAQVIDLWNRAAKIEEDTDTVGLTATDLVQQRGARPLGIGDLVRHALPPDVLRNTYGDMAELGGAIREYFAEDTFNEAPQLTTGEAPGIE